MNHSIKLRFEKLALAAAENSTAKKRRVGAVLTDLGERPFIGWNYLPGGGLCEDSDGNTKSTVVHAEVNVLAKFTASIRHAERNVWHIFITHQPCDNCLTAIRDAGIPDENIHIVNQFMKFDADKLRYDLLPPQCTAELVKVLTDGAKKYKPNNWQHGERDRYYAAMMRHLEASRLGEVFDTDSGSPHMAHVMANATFILWMDLKKQENEQK